MPAKIAPSFTRLDSPPNGKASATSPGPARTSWALRRRPVRAALAGVLVVVFALVGAEVYLRAGHTQGVLVVSAPIPQGGTISASDLGVANLSASRSLHPMPAADESSVIGHRAAVALLPGELMTTGLLAHGPTLAANHGEVGLTLNSSEMPSGVLVAGDSVEVVSTATTATGTARGAASSLVLTNAVVADSPVSNTSSGGTVLSIIVPSSAVAASVAVAAANGHIALVLLPGNGAGQ